MKKINYLANVTTEVAKRLYDQDLLSTPEAIKIAKNYKLTDQKKEAKTHHIAGYVLNGFLNRKERRAAAKRAHYLPQDWRMYRSPDENSTDSRQTVVKETA